MIEKEKAKAYDKAIERAKKWHNISNPIYCNIITEKIFPELKEGEDEKIRKEIISILRNAYWTSNRNRFNELVAWLEKQGKTPADKIEPRFKVGDWVVFITSGSAYQVEKKENYEYTLRNIHGGLLCVSFSNEELIREWTIEDAKDGDVLSFYSEYKSSKMVQIGIIEKYVGKYGGCSNTFKIYVGVNWDNNLQIGKYMGCSINMGCSNIHPATKEQRDTLMKVMNDAGYEWDADKKELKKLVPNKFDPKILKPFDKILMRDHSTEEWDIGYFSYIKYDLAGFDLSDCEEEGEFLVYTAGGATYWYVIPYNEDTKHLIGTSDDAPEYYKYWED